MGAAFQAGTLPKEQVPGTNVVGYLKGIIERAKYDHGHSGYSGTLAEANGVRQVCNLFDTTEEACEWLEEHCEKWGPIVVVSTKTNWIFGAWCSS